MGITKNIELPTKVVSKYHRIKSVDRIKWNEDGTGTLQMIVEQYLSYEARKAGATSLSSIFKQFDLNKDLTGIIRYILYRAILPNAPEFEDYEVEQDGELGNMLRLLQYLSPAEMSVMIFALTDILETMNIDPEDQRDWYNTLKADTLSVI